MNESVNKKSFSQKIFSEPLALITLIITVIFGILNSGWFWEMLENEPVVDVYQEYGALGRCFDSEIVIANESKNPIKNIRLTINVDRFVKFGDIEAGYGSLKMLLYPPGEPTLAPRKDDYRVNYTYDTENHVLSIAELRPAESVHFKYYEIEKEKKSLLKRNKLIKNANSDFSRLPNVLIATHDDGALKLNRYPNSKCKN